MSTIIDDFVVKMRLEGAEWAQETKKVENGIKDVKKELKEL